MLIPTLVPPIVSTTWDSFAENLEQAAARRARPFGDPDNAQEADERARESHSAGATRIQLSVSELLPFPFEAIDTAIAYTVSAVDHALRDALGFCLPAMPAATLGMLHVGIPHLHAHPPAMPIPLPSIGNVALGGCYSVLLSGLPAARVSDLGFAISCGSLSPIFQIDTGSSNVFIGNRRAARVCDFTRHCQPQSPFETIVSAAFNVNSTVGALLKAERSMHRSGHSAEDAANATDSARAQSFAAEQAGHQLNATVQAAQAVAEAAALAFRMLMGRDPATTPTGGVLLTGHPRIFIGGIPLKSTQSVIAKKLAGGALTGLAKRLAPVVRDLGKARKLDFWLRGTFTSGRHKNPLHQSLCILTGHPVDVIAGRFVVDTIDAELPGALPLRFARSYSSTWADRPSPLGRGWSHSLDEAVWCEPGQLVWRADDGRELELPLADHDIFCPQHRVTVRPLPGGGWQIEDPHHILRDFHPLAPSSDRLARLTRIHDRRGHRIDLEYTDNNLTRAHTPDGRELRLHYDDGGRLIKLDLPDPDADGLVPHTHYTHDGDDLVAITDVLGHVTRYRLDDHRIVEEALPNGLRFHFEYDGPDPDAACTRTRGDGGILDHTLIYDRPRRTTMVTNSCKEICIVRYGPRGEPLAVTDARGATTRYEYDEHLRCTAVHDPLGRTTRHTYDARGNRTRTVGPDGAATTTEYDRDLPVAATDLAGGRWRWSYDTNDRLTRRTDPLGRTTTFAHDGLTTLVTHPDGRRDRHTFHPSGALARIDYADGRVLQHTLDRRGRLVRTDHPDGTHESLHHDLHGRPTRHDLPGGDVRHFSYDALGCLVRLCDARTDLRLTYTGLRWLASVGPIDAAPYTLERDLEGRVLRVADADGTLLQADRDACGQLRVAVDARGHRRWTRDLAGRVTAVSHAGAITRITHDLAGRPNHIHHPDGARDELTWRPDGALLSATRHDAAGVTTIRRELDACGRLLREWQDDHWVALTHDLRDRVTHLRSSRGADVRLHHDDRGLARVALPAADWSILCERDRHGREHVRQLPGGVTAWWHRDARGRLHEHGVTGSRPPQIHRHRRYTWSPDDRLLADIDLTLRPRARSVDPPTCPIDQPALPLRHDALGRCIAAGPVQWQWCGDLPVHTLTTAAPTTWVFPTAPAPVFAPTHIPAPPLRATPVTAPILDPRTFLPSSSPIPTPLARLSADQRHALLTDPTGLRTAFDEHGVPVALPLDLPPATPTLDLFGRPHTDAIALAIITAELAPDLPDLAPPPRLP